MKKNAFFLTCLCLAISLSGCKIFKLKDENKVLKEKIAVLETENARLKETADFHYQQGISKAAAKNFAQAKMEFEVITLLYPTNSLAPLARKQLIGVNKDLEEQQRLAEQKRKQEEESRAWSIKIRQLHADIINQGKLDKKLGTHTKATDFIAQKIGKPQDSFHGPYRYGYFLIWGASLKNMVLREIIRKAPLSMTMSENLLCEQYTATSITYATYGENIKVGD